MQTLFSLERDKTVLEKLFSLVQQTLLQAQTFLRHHSISSSGGFNLLLNGIRILKVTTLARSRTQSQTVGCGHLSFGLLGNLFC